MDWRCTVRRAGEPATYLPCEQMGIFFSPERVDEEAGITRYRITVRNDSGADFLGIIHIQLLEEMREPKFFLPGFLYNRNTGDFPSTGRKAFPRLRLGGSVCPESEYFMVRSDRLAEPMGVVFDNGRVWGLSAPPCWVGSAYGKEAAAPSEETPFLQFAGFSCSMNEGGRAAVGYTLGYENAPWLFVQTATVLDRMEVGGENAFLLASGEEVHVPVTVYDYPAEDERSVMRAVRHTYFAFRQKPRTVPGMNPTEAVRLLTGAIREDAWLEQERMYSGFVFDRPEGYAYNKIGSLTWTNGLAVAVPMLLAANRLGDDIAREQSLRFLSEVEAHSFNPDAKLLYEAVSDGVWSVRGWWYDGMHSGGHSGYLNGQAVYYLLTAYQSELEIRGVEHKGWLELVRPVVAQMNRVRNADGEYPFAMSRHTGAGIEYDSMGSAWCLAATALYAQVTGETGYDEILRSSEEHYHRTFVKRMECYGGPLDTDKAVDSEGVLAYIRATRLLHMRFGEKRYLDHLKDGIEYETTFKLGWNTPVQVPPLSSVGWSSCGGSITSTANPHIHPMSSSIIGQMRYLAELTGDPYITERLRDTVDWSLQTFNTRDGEYGYGKTGWMSERFCFCQGLLTEKYPDGSPASTWFALMPWASASIIEGLISLIE